MSILIQSYQYQKQANEVIEVLLDDQAYLNATKVATAFGKLVRNWYRSQRVIEYMIAIAKKYNLLIPEIEERDFRTALKLVAKQMNFSVEDHNKAVCGFPQTEQKQLIITIQGGIPDQQGTWLHPKLAIEFARWLSAEFAVWCDQHIEMILKGHQILSLESLSNLLDQKITILKQDLLIEIDKKLEEKLEKKLEEKQKTLIFDYLSVLYEQGAITQQQLIVLQEKLNLPTLSNQASLDCPSQEQLKLEAQLLRENGYSWQNIAAKFNERNIPTLSGRGCWTASSIQYLVKK